MLASATWPARTKQALAALEPERQQVRVCRLWLSNLQIWECLYPFDIPSGKNSLADPNGWREFAASIAMEALTTTVRAFVRMAPAITHPAFVG